MKTLLLPLCLLLVTQVGYAQAPSSYHVIGDVQGLSEKSKVYLINGGLRKTIDSAAVKQGHFVLTGHLAEPAHLYLHAGKGRASTKLADILLDNRTVHVSGSQPDYDHVTITGSDIDRQWKEWYREDTEIGAQRYKIKQVATSLTEKQDTANANALKRIMAEMQQARVRLLKSYVARYHDSAAGAMLTDLCTLGPILTAADYEQLYQLLTPTWQQSSFGKDLLVQVRKKRAAPK